MMLRFFSWLKSTEGATAIEYGLIVGGIGLAVSVVVFTIGEDLLSIFTNIDNKVQSRLD